MVPLWFRRAGKGGLRCRKPWDGPEAALRLTLRRAQLFVNEVVEVDSDSRRSRDLSRRAAGVSK